MIQDRKSIFHTKAMASIRNYWFVLLNLLLLALTACTQEDIVRKQPVQIEVKFLEEALNDVCPDQLKIKITSKTASYTVEALTNEQGFVEVNLEDGIYDITVSGTKTCRYVDQQGKTQTSTVNLTGNKENLKIVPGMSVPIAIEACMNVEGRGWVIKELFASGTTTPQKKTYYGDQYVELYNNTDSVLYADGITIAESAQLTCGDKIINSYASVVKFRTNVQTAYMIPGNGTDYPVEPGKGILISAKPINHIAEGQANSFNLSKSSFQWYDNTGNASQSIDVPDIPNLIKYYSNSLTIWILHTRGYKSFVIFRIDDMPMDVYVRNNMKQYPNWVGNMVNSLEVENKYILDAVECGPPELLAHKALSPSLDAGSSYISAAYSKKSIRRKVKEVINGRTVYQDTNNSTADFIPDAEPQPFTYNKIAE